MVNDVHMYCLWCLLHLNCSIEYARHKDRNDGGAKPIISSPSEASQIQASLYAQFDQMSSWCDLSTVCGASGLHAQMVITYRLHVS